jgi:hypothetical protein
MPNVFIDKGKRVKLTLRDAALLRRGEEKRHHFKVDIVLSDGDDALNGMPEWVQNAYTNLIKTGNLATMQKFDVRLENATVEMFPTPKGRRFFSPIMDATLSSFVMTRTGKGDEDAVVTLSFSAYFPGRKEIHEWTFDHKTANFWAAFEEAQGDLNFAGTGAEDDDQEDLPLGEEDDEDGDDASEDDEEEDEIEAQAARRNAKVVAAPKPTPPAKKPLTESQQIAKAKETLQLM